MARYGMMGPSVSSGFGGGTGAAIGNIGANWYDSFLMGLGLENQIYNHQNRVAMDQFALPAEAARLDNAYQNQAAQAIMGNQNRQALNFAQMHENPQLSAQALASLGLTPPTNAGLPQTTQEARPNPGLGVDYQAAMAQMFPTAGPVPGQLTGANVGLYGGGVPAQATPQAAPQMPNYSAAGANAAAYGNPQDILGAYGTLLPLDMYPQGY